MMDFDLEAKVCVRCKKEIKGSRYWSTWHVMGELQKEMTTGPYDKKCFDEHVSPYVADVLQATTNN